MMIKEVSPATITRAQELASLLMSAQELANQLVRNDDLKVLKIDGVNIDALIMNCRHKVLEYQKDIHAAMNQTF